MSRIEHHNYKLIPLLFVLSIDAFGFALVFPLFSALILSNATHMFAATSSLATRNFWFEFTIGIYCICMFFNSPVLGSLSDRYGRKKILVFSLAGLAVGYAVMATAILLNSLAGIILGRIISGATAGSYPIAQAGVIDLSHPEQKTKALGLVALVNGASFSLGPVLGGLLVSPFFLRHMGYSLAFWLFAGFALLGILIMLFGYQEIYQGNSTQKIHLFTSFQNLYQAFNTPKIRAFCSVLLFYFSGYTIFLTLIPIYITTNFHKSNSWIGYFIAYFSVIFSLSPLLLSRFLRNDLLAKFIRIGLVIFIIFNILFLLLPVSILLWIIVVPLAVITPLVYVALMTLLSNNTDSQNQGKMMGIAGSLAALSWGAGPLAAGILNKVYPGVPYFVGILLLVIAVSIKI